MRHVKITGGLKAAGAVFGMRQFSTAMLHERLNRDQSRAFPNPRLRPLRPHPHRGMNRDMSRVTKRLANLLLSPKPRRTPPGLATKQVPASPALNALS